MKDSGKGGAGQNSEEFIFGKNAVLAFLQQSKVPGAHEMVRNALLVEALEQSRQLAKSQEPDSAESRQMEKRLQESIAALREKGGPGPLEDYFLSQKELRIGGRINRIMIATGLEHDGRIDSIKELARVHKIPLVSCDKRKLDQLAGPAKRHQGVVAFVSAAEFWQLETFLQKLILDKAARQLNDVSMDGYMVAVLDGIEDPHNLGSIIRVAEAAGFKAIFIPQRRSAGLTGTVAKTSAGALACMPIVRVSNLAHLLETLKKFGFWIVGLDGGANLTYTDTDLVMPLVLVIGSEGSGLSRLVREHCDYLVKIPMIGRTESLNASVAAGIVFYEALRQCQKSGKYTAGF